MTPILSGHFNQQSYNRLESVLDKSMQQMGSKKEIKDYEQPMGWKKDPYSKQTGRVIKNEELEGASDYSYDPTSKKKFGLDLYPSEGE